MVRNRALAQFAANCRYGYTLTFASLKKKNIILKRKLYTCLKNVKNYQQL